MKNLLIGVILLSVLGCYKENGEPLRTVYNLNKTGDTTPVLASPPCEDDLVLNSYTESNYRTYYNDVRGLTGGKYINGYFIYASNTNDDYYFRIEFQNKPTTKKNYTAATTNNNSDDECIIYATHRITSEELFLDENNPVFVDVRSNGEISVSICDQQFNHLVGSNSVYIQNLNVIPTN